MNTTTKGNLGRSLFDLNHNSPLREANKGTQAGQEGGGLSEAGAGKEAMESSVTYWLAQPAFL